MIKKIDIYIIKKFLGTFFFSILLIIAIAIVLDMSEKIDSFREAPLSEIIVDHYLNFIPFYANLFSPLFTLIAVLYFTSRMAARFEIVAMVSSGISFYRIFVPYMISALLIAILVYMLGNFIIPDANKDRIAFEDTYVNSPFKNKEINIHRQISRDEYLYMERYNNMTRTGYKFSLEKFDDNKLIYKLLSDSAMYDSITREWDVKNYYARTLYEDSSVVTSGAQMDTILNFEPTELSRRPNFVAETMDFRELNQHIETLLFRGYKVDKYLVEKYKREAIPFSIIILTIIGLTVSLRDMRGGTGAYVGFGIILSFTYILLNKVSVTYGIEGNLHPRFAVWLPNILFSLVASYLIWTTPK